MVKHQSLPTRTGSMRRSADSVLEKEPLQVRIPVAVKRRFKSHAALKGLEPNELFIQIWELYEASLGPETADGSPTGGR